jgi:hypothetical protein
MVTPEGKIQGTRVGLRGGKKRIEKGIKETNEEIV